MSAVRVTRRRWLSSAVAVAALLLSGLAYELLPDPLRKNERYRFAWLNPEDRVILAAIAPVMLGVAGAEERVLIGLDRAILDLPPLARAQIAQLLALLRFPLTRMFVAGIWQRWSAASPAAIAAFLTRWRFSNFITLRGGYDALHQLISAAWYGDAASWPAIRYPGPPKLP